MVSGQPRVSIVRTGGLNERQGIWWPAPSGNLGRRGGVVHYASAEAYALLGVGRTADRTIQAGAKCVTLLLLRDSGSQNRRSPPLPAALTTPVPPAQVKQITDTLRAVAGRGVGFLRCPATTTPHFGSDMPPLTTVQFAPSKRTIDPTTTSLKNSTETE